MGSTGIVISARGSGNIKLLPIGGSGRVGDYEARGKENGFGNPNNEYGALFTATGTPVIGYAGDRHSVAVDDRVLNTPGAIFTHRHPDGSFGGTLSMQDLRVFAKSQLGELRAFSKQGQLYSIKAGQNVDREGLAKWVRSHEKMYAKNFRNSYESALKNATTPLKSGPHKGMVKIASGRQGGKTQYRYVKPMTPTQAESYARQFSVGQYERAYKKALGKFGITYTSTKAGRSR